jgi:NAD(P)-dependent dehydrogenase (short-subunit alcohol dehydrogenase family)
MGSLDGNVALVTGASRGIGRAIAERLAAEGADVALNDHAPRGDDMDAAVAAVAAHGSAADYFQADVSDASAVQTMVDGVLERYERIDIVVNNAGVACPGAIEDLSEADWDRTLGINLKGQFLVSRAVIPGMRARGAGRIVNIASELGLVGEADLSPYCASKAGVIGLTKSLARELAPARVRVNCVAPGPTDTSILRDTERTPEYLATIPLGRLGTPAEIAWAVWYLASPHAEWITGQVLSPNGGVVM